MTHTGRVVRFFGGSVLVLIASSCRLGAQDETANPAWQMLSLDDTTTARLRSAISKRDYKRAETLLVQQIDLHPSSPDLLILAGRVFLADKDPVNAAIAFKKADKIRPLEPTDRLSLAIAFIGMKRPTWGKLELNRVLADDPHNADGQYWLARLEYDDRLYDSAIQRLQGVVDAHPEFARAWDNLGLSLEAVGKLDEARQAYGRGVELNRKQQLPSAWPPLNFGIFLTRLGKLDTAELLLRESLRYDERFPKAHYRLGVNLERQKKHSDAVAELRRAVELAPAEPQPFYELAKIYRALGNKAGADEALANFRELKKRQRGG